MKENSHPKHVLRALERLKNGNTLRRSYSTSEEAQIRGGGYLYSLYPGDRKFPTVSGRYIVEHGLVESNKDGLFGDTPQTFSLPSASAGE
ncbi:hypothetical protein [Cohaesibacter gelatinilyticus]|uniref:Uncharacterized protein n=1 Tax=Cohaesibacter gelatinilyticus TaxID=372072 RepID=A0A285PIZ8_9HYPH|nr:hypothetical protein [Cohaesibacter gelatinilyticus]SNZ21695.1 hypothetical protein SAMN06265368_4820 [Cohaesibacter gelatinilyticus]